MINAPRLLADLTRQLKRLESDLLQRIEEVQELKASLQAEWQAARDANRNAETFETWVDQVITQAGVHWLLSCVFLRFIEDNELVARPWLGGTPASGRLALARDRHEAYFREHPLENDRDYLLAAFREAEALPGLHSFFDEKHNPVFRLGMSGDAAMGLRQFWQQVDPNTGALLHDFTDPDWNTRFLGDLYQDLSEATRKRYALLQTPEFVEEFILDRTLTPAIQEFGFREVRMIDPTCGSGHFLLGGFYRLLAEWQRNEPGRNLVDMAQKALDGVAGVDLNPFAVAITRFRLFVAALQVSGVRQLANAHDFTLSVAIGDSLLHGTRFGLKQSQDLFDAAASHADTGLAHAYASEDLGEVQRILGRQYHAVVGNPPYIVVKDAALNAAYRRKYASCHMKYSLGAPFTERFFELAITSAVGGSAGYVGLITTNSFMKREFGSKLIEQVFPRLDLTHVIDTSGAVLPGHGTDTVILFGRHRSPCDVVVRTVMGKKKEPSNPEDPAKGLVWGAILEQIDDVGSESIFVSVSDSPRITLAKHPWSVSGGGGAGLREQLEQLNPRRVGAISNIGIAVVTLEDEAFQLDHATVTRRRFDPRFIRAFVVGDALRDWAAHDIGPALYPHLPISFEPYIDEPMRKWLWPLRTNLSNRQWFKKSQLQRGLAWYAYGHISKEKFVGSLTIAFAEIASHNHFVLDRGEAVFKQTAPVIKLPIESSEDDYLGLLGLLNSSVVCFWLKQVCQRKGAHLAGNRTREERYSFNSSNVADIPVTDIKPVQIAARLEAQSRQLAALHPMALLAHVALPARSSLDTASELAGKLRRQMIADQEELDWRCYRLYGLLPPDIEVDAVEYASEVEVELGERAFEIVLARRIAAGLEQTSWFERHGSIPTTEIPSRWPENYRRVVARRIELIQHDKSIGILERPEFKRRWKTDGWKELELAALRNWLLARLESPTLWPSSVDLPATITSTARLAEAISLDSEFMHVAGLYAGHADFDLSKLVADLVAVEAVPALPTQRYTDTGLRKYAQWQNTWHLQRIEDDLNANTSQIGSIPVPPKYQSKDFLKPEFWRLRGELDIPRERWISFPGCERGTDGSLVIAWAGWNHLQQATAIASYYLNMKDAEGWEPTRLQPLLAGLLELVPWLEQWHNEVDPVYGERMGDYYRAFISDEARSLGFTLDDLRTWKPAFVAAKRGRRKAS